MQVPHPAVNRAADAPGQAESDPSPNADPSAGKVSVKAMAATVPATIADQASAEPPDPAVTSAG